MMKILRKFRNELLIFILLVTCFISPVSRVKGKTLGDLKKQLQDQIAEYERTQNEKKLTEAQYNNVRGNITSIQNEIVDNQNTIVRLGEEIDTLNEDILKKEEEIKEIIRFYQLSQGESTYLEYVFGAADFTDFIYRLAISEQLTQYNKDLIKEQNQMIEDNKKKQEELKQQETELNNKQVRLNQELNSLGSQISEIIDLTVDIEEEIKLQKEAIALYEKQYNCKDSDEISVCTANKLPADTSFWRPLVTGHRSSEFGSRTYTLNGRRVTDFHTGIDITTSPNDNVPVYAAANGRVAGVVYKSSCGGNKIYIHHNIKGVSYTTSYVHLRKILVSVGDTVTKDTQIAVMGGNPSIETWDGCSTGAHLHFGVAYGLYLKDYTNWNTFISKSINPRSIVNFPSGGGTFYNRTTKY